MAGTSHALRPRRRKADRATAKDPDDAGEGSGGAEERKHRAAHLKQSVDERREHLLAQRSTSHRVDTAFRWLERHTETGGALLAGAIAFRIFLLLLPCVFVIVIGLGAGSDLVGADPRQVASTLGMAGLAARAIEAGANSSAPTRWVTFAFVVLALVLAARNMFRALIVVHSLIWRLPFGRPRHALVKGLGVVVFLFVGTLLLRAVYLVRSDSLVAWVFGLALFTLFPAGIWLACSVFVFPHPPAATWRDLLPGAVLFGAGVEALHLATVLWFAPYLQSKAETYGTIGAAIAILVWAYVLGRLITGAVTLNAVLWHEGGAPARPDPAREPRDGPD